MAAEPYLIAHRVRGEPAFDIAIQLEGSGTESDPGPWWIIPTSGHRAYPYWQVALADGCENIANLSRDATGSFIPPICPQDWPDHYQATAAPKGQGTITAASLLQKIGLLQPPTIRRR